MYRDQKNRNCIESKCTKTEMVWNQNVQKTEMVWNQNVQKTEMVWNQNVQKTEMVWNQNVESKCKKQKWEKGYLAKTNLSAVVWRPRLAPFRYGNPRAGSPTPFPPQPAKCRLPEDCKKCPGLPSPNDIAMDALGRQKYRLLSPDPRPPPTKFRRKHPRNIVCCHAMLLFTKRM
ncbi:hypothetical protein CEXT_608241 [Caerostris extrusa]|uniref:Uncharacterized protein n=1 Tax=Caerostris extrusa TaxID=172846 RepID=A0AAV4TFZ2_CAEEX|nr:hypothetical protein CEXT_608241 [Caerostris extrusa]